jgi:hypothetical protein
MPVQDSNMPPERSIARAGHHRAHFARPAHMRGIAIRKHDHSD